MPDAPSPTIGIVIPVYGHTRLVAEAIESVARQDFAGDLVTVVVIDGDASPELMDVMTAMRSRTALHVLFRKNGRLPAARNTGIAFLLDILPSLDAVYFLDADNRLSPHSIARFWSELERHPEAGWAYPDIGFFGIGWSQRGVDVRQTAPRYSELRHLMGNICEAGSMVRADLLRAGLRFDESFNVGYEDWDFWLQCLGAGHHGTPVDDSGFRYRRRSDSMLAEADRRSQEIKDRIWEKHQALYAPEHIAELYCSQFAPFVLLDSNGDLVLLAADGRELGRGDEPVVALVAQARTSFHFTYLPRFVIAAQAGWDIASAMSLERSISLLENAGHEPVSVNADFAIAEGDMEAQARLVLFARLAADASALPPAFAVAAERLAAILGGITIPDRENSDRYAGPASYRIDAFVAERLRGAKAESDPGEPAAAAALKRRVMALDQLGRWPHNGLTRPHAPPPSLDLANDMAASASAICYMGQAMSYAPPLADNSATTADADELIIVEDWRSLPFSRDLFAGHGARICYVCSDVPGPPELAAIQCTEHSLAAIFCSDATGPLLTGLGVPRRKVFGAADLAARLAASA